MLKPVGFVAIMSLVTLTLTAARPQETATEENILQQDALSNVDGEHPLLSGIDEGFQHDEETERYEGQGTEITTVTDVLEPSTESNGSPTEILFRESQEPFNLLPSTHEASQLSQDVESSPSLPTQEASPVFREQTSPSPSSSSPLSFPTQGASQSLFPGNGTSPLFAPATAPSQKNQALPAGNQANSPNMLIGSLWQMLNNSQRGNATAGGAGSGSVYNNTAIGQGTGIANVGLGGFGIGLGIGGAIQTSLGNLAFGQGNGIALG
ncbi:uncharacterized protein LOC130700013 [Daphnia carinata]|uniref:uncharacterized protein LOC130700013 n=1 Tax=Daphnia carinata TaxID=120202 RepID=UPI002868FECB|nr:uncharacterized protein LOC130700013 [Daphnia carinata]